jgi:hypothetical protein
MALLLLMTTFAAINPLEGLAVSGLAKVTVKVVDEGGQPVEGANAGVGFQYDLDWATEVNSKKGLTDENGTFTAAGTGNGYIGYGAEKNGYYDSSYNYEFIEKGPSGWKPWNPELKVVMRKIENPVPMYARDTVQSTIEIPVVEKEVGFDLVVFDWIAPYGKGSHPDFTFKLQRHVINRKDFDGTLIITFPNKFDGIQSYREDLSRGSVFKLLRFAPESGYENTLILKEWRKPNDYNVKRNFNFVDDDYNYFFRIRSEEKDGQLVKAMYGKILGPIDFTVVFSKTAKIYFKYYLNPDYNRNLEFDPKRNLFGSLPLLEQVGIQ